MPPIEALRAQDGSNAEAADELIARSAEFAVPVRFDTDHMAVTIESYQLHAGSRSRSSSSEADANNAATAPHQVIGSYVLASSSSSGGKFSEK